MSNDAMKERGRCTTRQRTVVAVLARSLFCSMLALSLAGCALSYLRYDQQYYLNLRKGHPYGILAFRPSHPGHLTFQWGALRRYAWDTVKPELSLVENDYTVPDGLTPIGIQGPGWAPWLQRGMTLFWYSRWTPGLVYAPSGSAVPARKSLFPSYELGLQVGRGARPLSPFSKARYANVFCLDDFFLIPLPRGTYLLEAVMFQVEVPKLGGKTTTKLRMIPINQKIRIAENEITYVGSLYFRDTYDQVRIHRGIESTTFEMVPKDESEQLKVALVARMTRSGNEPPADVRKIGQYAWTSDSVMNWLLYDTKRLEKQGEFLGVRTELLDPIKP